METLHYTSDHDLLVAINTKLDLWIPEMKGDIRDLQERVTVLERSADRQSGFISGGKALWGFITALPAGVAGVLIGRHTGLGG